MVDFSKVGYTAKLREKRSDPIALGVIKNKCFLYNTTSELSITKSYLINRDFVSILEKSGQWTKIEYINPANNKKIEKWIKSIGLYDANPLKW